MGVNLAIWHAPQGLATTYHGHTQLFRFLSPSAQGLIPFLSIQLVWVSKVHLHEVLMGGQAVTFSHLASSFSGHTSDTAGRPSLEC